MAFCTPDDLGLSCTSCKKTFDRKFLTCGHSISRLLLEELSNNHPILLCPDCGENCSLPLRQGIDGLPGDSDAIHYLKDLEASTCTGAKNKHAQTCCTRLVASCWHCGIKLCEKSAKAHQDMTIFEKHKVKKLHHCLQHKEILEYFCEQCNARVCQECMYTDHHGSLHRCHRISEGVLRKIDFHKDEAKIKSAQDTLEDQKYLRARTKTMGSSSLLNALSSINASVYKSNALRSESNKMSSAYTHTLYRTPEQRTKWICGKIMKNDEQHKKMTSFVDHTKKSDSSEAVKSSLPTKCPDFGECDPKLDWHGLGLSTSSNTLVNKCNALSSEFNKMSSRCEAEPSGYKHTFFRTPEQNSELAKLISCRGKYYAEQQKKMTSFADHTKKSYSSEAVKSSLPKCQGFWEYNPKLECNGLGSYPSLNDLVKKFSAPLCSESNKMSSGHEAAPRLCEMWPSGLSYWQPNDAVISPPLNKEPEMKTSDYPHTSIRNQIYRHTMTYYKFFGEFGINEGQFTEPSGLAVNSQLEIFVADTNSHRIQIFDKEGGFKFTFGTWGKSDGQLAYPNAVAVWKKTGDIVITERSPTHQIQIYNQYGQFVRKFGDDILRYPRAVTVDDKGRIIVVECKVMRVVIFDQNGKVLKSFICENLEFPNGVAVNGGEIFICDNKAHCVKVFDYNGQFLRKIGGLGITNYPIGVGINEHGNVVVADNHGHFNITVFSQAGGTPLYASQSKSKHSQCFGIVLLNNESVAVSTKDYRVYIYNSNPSRNMQLQSNHLQTSIFF